jgi:crotonobetainyl-CoA:carnitine CoA-transferase CaiB-like acyl-CoA transferase
VTAPPPPLEGVRVVELGELVTAPWAGRYLALLGADVIKVEQPGGECSRRRGPFPGDRPDAEESGLYRYLNVEKRGITLNLDHADAAGVLRALLAGSDIFLENLGQDFLAARGMAFEDLQDVSDELIVGAITPFGLTGPRAGEQATDLGVFHAGGEGYTLPGGLGWRLYPDREPLKGPDFTAHYDAGTTAAIALLTTLLGRQLGNSAGAGAELVDLSEQEALVGLNRLEMQRYPTRGFEESRATRALPVGDVVQASDGFVAVAPLAFEMWQGLCRAMERPDLLEDERFADWPTLIENSHEAGQYIHEWAIAHDKEHVYLEAQRHGCAAGLVRTPQDLLEAEQLRATGFFATLGDSDLEVPRAPFRISESTAIEPYAKQRLGRAPRLGEHNAEIYGELLGWDAEAVSWQRRAGLI